jgi:hypothetical protein
LDSWTLDELIGHYVNYRKQISPSLDELLPVEDFRLYAVCTRYPQKLATAAPMQPRQEGVYDVQWGLRWIRIIVLSQIPQTKNNALWELFSAIPDKVQYGAAQYQWHIPDHSTTVYKLYELYQVEAIAMAYTYEDFYRDFTKEHLNDLAPDDLLQVLSVEDRLKGLSAEELLRKLLEQMSPEELEAYVKQYRQGQNN